MSLEEENKRLKEEIRCLKEQLQKAEAHKRQKSAFIANFSHEVKTPLAGIVGLLGKLQLNEKFSDKERKMIALISNNSEHLLTLLDDILDETKIETGQLTIQSEAVDISKMMIEMQIFFENYMQRKNKKNIHIEACIDEAVGNGIIRVDPVRLKQILYNLLSNAVKFTEKGYINFGYRLTDNHMIEFWVEDTGAGIPSDQLIHIFERHGQAEHSDNKQYRGAGLGLSISKTLSHLMGGDLCVKSVYGKGSTFYLTIQYIAQ